MRKRSAIAVLLAGLALAGPAVAQEPEEAPPAAPFELVGPPAFPEAASQERAIAWSKEQREAEARAARKQANIFCTVSAVDLGLTEAVLARSNGIERNPLVRNRGLRIGLSAATCIAAQIEARGAHPKASQLKKANWVRLAAVVVNVVVLARSH